MAILRVMGLRWFTKPNLSRKRSKALLLGSAVVLYLVLTCVSMVLNYQTVNLNSLKRDSVVNVRTDGYNRGYWRRRIRDVHNDWNRTRDEYDHFRSEANEEYDSVEREYGLFMDTGLYDNDLNSEKDGGKDSQTDSNNNVAVPEVNKDVDTNINDAREGTMSAMFRTNIGQNNEINVNINKDGNRLPNINKTAQRRLPQAIIVGVKKCGTRALLEYLRIHPDIRAPGPETHFFDRNYHRGLEWYRSEMPTSLEEQITMEKTPRYFVTYDVPKRIYDLSKDTKLVVVVRDPVTRAISDFTQAISKELPPLNKVTFSQKAFRRNGTGDINTHWSAIKTGFYAQHLKRWLEYFPADHIHFVSGENLIIDPAQEVKHVEDFLGLKRVISDKHFYFNETKGFPCLKKHEGSPVARCFNSSKGRRHKYVDPLTIKRLKLFFKPYNEEFYKIAGRDFGW